MGPVGNVFGILCRSQLGNKQQLVDRLVAATSAEQAGPEPPKKRQKKPAKKGGKAGEQHSHAEVRITDAGNGPFAGVKGKPPHMEEDLLIFLAPNVHMVRFAVLYKGEGKETEFRSLEMLEEHAYDGVKYHVVTDGGLLEDLRTIRKSGPLKMVNGKEAACKKLYNHLFAQATSEGYDEVDQWHSSIGSGRLQFFLPSCSTDLDIRVQRVVRRIFADMRRQLLSTKRQQYQLSRTFAGVCPKFEFGEHGDQPSGLTVEVGEQLYNTSIGMEQAAYGTETQAKFKDLNERFFSLLPHETPLQPSVDPRYETGVIGANEVGPFVQFSRQLKAALILNERSPGVFYNDSVDQMYSALHCEITPLDLDEEEGEEVKKMFARRLKHTDMEKPLPKAGSLPWAFFEAFKLRCSRLEAEFDGRKGNKHLLFAQGVDIPQLVNNDNDKWRCDSQAAGHKMSTGANSTVVWEVALGELKESADKAEEDYDSTVSYFQYECKNPAFRKPRYLLRFARYK